MVSIHNRPILQVEVVGEYNFTAKEWYPMTNLRVDVALLESLRCNRRIPRKDIMSNLGIGYRAWKRLMSRPDKFTLEQVGVVVDTLGIKYWQLVIE